MITYKKILTYKQVKLISNKLKKQNKIFVLVTGCFDILHLGHLIFLNYARKYGNILIVGIGSDKTIQKYK